MQKVQPIVRALIEQEKFEPNSLKFLNYDIYGRPCPTKVARTFRDVTYTKTAEKIRFKFNFGPGGLPESRKPKLRAKIKKALKAEGHKIEDVAVYRNEVLVYQKFPIEIIRK